MSFPSFNASSRQLLCQARDFLFATQPLDLSGRALPLTTPSSFNVHLSFAALLQLKHNLAAEGSLASPHRKNDVVLLDAELARLATCFDQFPYHALGLPAFASPKHVRKAYLKLAKQYHPDKNTHTQRLFVLLQSSYEKLSHTANRLKADHILKALADRISPSAAWKASTTKSPLFQRRRRQNPQQRTTESGQRPKTRPSTAQHAQSVPRSKQSPDTTQNMYSSVDPNSTQARANASYWKQRWKMRSDRTRKTNHSKFHDQQKNDTPSAGARSSNSQSANYVDPEHMYAQTGQPESYRRAKQVRTDAAARLRERHERQKVSGLLFVTACRNLSASCLKPFCLAILPDRVNHICCL